jgi:hypothetical protein
MVSRFPGYPVMHHLSPCFTGTIRNHGKSVRTTTQHQTTTKGDFHHQEHEGAASARSSPSRQIIRSKPKKAARHCGGKSSRRAADPYAGITRVRFQGLLLSSLLGAPLRHCVVFAYNILMTLVEVLMRPARHSMIAAAVTASASFWFDSRKPL